MSENTEGRASPADGVAAPRDDVRALDLLTAWGENWIVGKGQLSASEPPYGCQLFAGEEVCAEGEGQTLLEAVNAAFNGEGRAPAAASGGGEVLEEGDIAWMTAFVNNRGDPGRDDWRVWCRIRDALSRTAPPSPDIDRLTRERDMAVEALEAAKTYMESPTTDAEDVRAYLAVTEALKTIRGE